LPKFNPEPAFEAVLVSDSATTHRGRLSRLVPVTGLDRVEVRKLARSFVMSMGESCLIDFNKGGTTEITDNFVPDGWLSVFYMFEGDPDD
jgi:hypothetical protein